MGNKLENINIQNLSKNCESNGWVARNAYFHPKQSKKEYLATWYSSDGAISKQLDYILIEHRYRNWVTNITHDTPANMTSPMQQRAIILDLEITLKETILQTAIKHFAHMT